ncbi:YcxB family protein [Bradyrhizobium ganzhouense]|uniref:YcxB family protein n=1 Tax=Bradyrhizobium ganzhouense TaxID=1179767 RepID=UPI003CF9BCEE
MTGITNAFHEPEECDTGSVELQYVKADFIAAYQLHGAATRRVWTLVLVLALVIGGATFFHLREVTPTILAVAVVLIGAVLGTLAFACVILPWLARRTFARYPLSHLAHKLVLRPEGITLQSPRGISTLQWKDFIRWRTNSKTILIYTSPSTFIHFPARLAELGFPMDRLKVGLLRELGPPF